MLIVQAVFTELFPLNPPPIVTPPSYIPLLHTYIPHPSTIQVNWDRIKTKLGTSPLYLAFPLLRLAIPQVGGYV